MREALLRREDYRGTFFDIEWLWKEEGQPKLKFQECGFRKGDEKLAHTDPFRQAMIRHLVTLVNGADTLRTNVSPGMPRSVTEADATNRMVEAIGGAQSTDRSSGKQRALALSH